MKIERIWIPAAGLTAALAFVTLCPIRDRPHTGHPTLERAGAFALLGCALALALPRRPVTATTAIVVGAFALEALQLLAPDRHARVSDAVVKALGGLCGVLVGHAVLSRLRKGQCE